MQLSELLRDKNQLKREPKPTRMAFPTVSLPPTSPVLGARLTRLCRLKKLHDCAVDLLRVLLFPQTLQPPCPVLAHPRKVTTKGMRGRKSSTQYRFL